MSPRKEYLEACARTKGGQLLTWWPLDGIACINMKSCLPNTWITGDVSPPLPSTPSFKCACRNWTQVVWTKVGWHDCAISTKLFWALMPLDSSVLEFCPWKFFSGPVFGTIGLSGPGMNPHDSRWHLGAAKGPNSKVLSTYFSKRGLHFSLCSITVVNSTCSYQGPVFGPHWKISCRKLFWKVLGSVLG